MRINKVYNNNVVSVLNEKKEEMIVTGAGIGYKKKLGDFIDESRITQQFYLEDDKRKKIEKLLARVTVEHIELCEEILMKAAITLKKEINPYVLIPFTDHIVGAIQRVKEGMVLPNLTLLEVKTIWKEEFDFSLEALKIIYQKTGVQLPLDEAGYIAMYFIDDSSGTKESVELLDAVTDIVQIIECIYQIEMDKSSVTYMRLITHLRFFIGRIKNKEGIPESDNESIYNFLVNQNTKLLDFEIKLSKYMLEKFNYTVSESEILYLMIHITQILKK